MLSLARLAALLLLSLAPVGCAIGPAASPSAPARPARAATLQEVLAAYDGYCNGIQTLSASGDLDVRDLRAGKSQKLGVRLVAARGGRLYLKGSVAVVTALEVVADGERFWFQVPSKKTVWTGDSDGAAERDAGTEQAPYYALRPKDVTAALLPEPLAPGPGQALLLDSDRQTFSLTLGPLEAGRGIARRRIWLQRDTLEPLRVRNYDEQGDIASEVSLGAWGDGLPRFVSVLRPAQGYQASFSFSKLERNGSIPEKAFSARIPEGYKTVSVR